MKISVIIPTYNKYSYLLRTLESYKHVAFPKSDFEVIVCDDGSTDESKYIDASCFGYNLYVFHTAHHGRAFARNVCLNHANGDVVVFSDDDTVTDSSFLKIHYQLHLCERNIVALGHRKQLYLMNCRNDFHFEVLNSSESLFYSEFVNNVFDSQRYTCKWMCFFTGNLSLEMCDLKKIGFFDENYRSWGIEDFDLGYRAVFAGMRFVFLKDAVNYHMYHARDEKFLDGMITNGKYFYSKYGKATEIYNFWEYYCGRISLGEFDRRTQREFSTYKDCYFSTFVRYKILNLDILCM